MSGFSGDITSTTYGGLTLNFTGAGRETASGTGAISLSPYRDLTYTLEGDSSIKNSSLYAQNIIFNAGSTFDATTGEKLDYLVSSQMRADADITIGANVELTLQSGASIDSASVTVDATGGFILQTGSSLTTTTVNGAMTVQGGTSLGINISSPSSPAMSIGSLSYDNTSGSGLTLNINYSGTWVYDTAYTLISLTDTEWSSLGLTLEDFTILFADSTVEYELSFDGGNLILTTLMPNDACVHESGDITWKNDANLTDWKNDKAFTDGRSVTIGTVDDGLGGTVTIEGSVMPSSIQVIGSADWTLSGTGGIVGSSELVKLGSGALTIETANSFSGGTTLSEGSIIMGNAVALGSGSITFDGGLLIVDVAGEMTLANAIVGALNLEVAAGTTLTLNSYGDSAASLSVESGGTLVMAATAQSDTSLQHLVDGAGDISYTGSVQTILSPIGFSGTITAQEGSTGLIIVTSRAMDDVPDSDRFNLVLNASIAVGHTQAVGSQSLKLSGLSGTGDISISALAGSYRHVDLDILMTEDNQWDGALTCSGTSVGGLILDSAQDDSVDGSEHYTFTMTKEQTFSASNNSYTGLHIHNATLRFEDAANWNSSFTFEHEDARLVLAGNDLSFGVSTSGEGADKVYGFYSSTEGYGTVEVNTDNTITISRENSSFTGAFEIVKGTLVVENAAALGSSSMTMSGGVLSIASGLELSYAKDFTQTAGVISGEGALSFTAGNISLAGDNSYTGGTTINGTSVTVGHANALGTGAVTLTSGSLEIAEGISFGIDSSFTQAAGSAITGAGGLTIENGASYTHTANNTFTGALVVSSGATATLAANANKVTLNGGSLVATGAGLSITTNLNVTANSSLSISATGAGIDLSGASLSIASGSSLTLNLDSAIASGAECVIFTGVSADTFTDWTFETIYTTDGELEVILASSVLTGGDNLSFTDDYYLYINADGELVLSDQLVFSSEHTWAGGDDGLWSVGGSGWDGGNFANGRSVTFDETSTQANVTVDAAGVEVQNMTISGSHYSFAEGSITIAGALNIENASADMDSDVIFGEGATITITGANSSLSLEGVTGTLASLSNEGSLTAASDLSISGAFSNSGNIDLGSNKLTLSSTDAIDAGKILAGSMQVNAALTLADGSTITGALAGATSLTTAGSVSLGSLSSTNLSTLSQGSGTLSIGGEGSITVTGSYSNVGTIDAASYSLDLTSQADVTAGTLKVKDLTVAGKLSLDSASSITGNLTGATSLSIAGASTLVLGAVDSSLTSITINAAPTAGPSLSVGSLAAASIAISMDASRLSSLGLDDKESYLLIDISGYTGEFVLNGGSTVPDSAGGLYSLDSNGLLTYTISSVIWGEGSYDVVWDDTTTVSNVDVLFNGSGTSDVKIEGAQKALGITINLSDSAQLDSYTFKAEAGSADASLSTGDLNVVKGQVAIAMEVDVSASYLSSSSEITPDGTVTVGANDASLSVTTQGNLSADKMQINSSYSAAGTGFLNEGTTTIKDSLMAVDKNIANTGQLILGDGTQGESTIGSITGSGTTSVMGEHSLNLSGFDAKATLQIAADATVNFSADVTLNGAKVEGSLNALSSSLTLADATADIAGSITAQGIVVNQGSIGRLSSSKITLNQLAYAVPVTPTMALLVADSITSPQYVLSVDELKSTGGSIEISLTTLGVNTELGSYYLIENVANSAISFSWADEMADVITAMRLEHLGVKLETDADGNLVLNVVDAAFTTWSTSSNEAIDTDGVVTTSAIYENAQVVDGVTVADLISYDVLDLVDSVEVNKSIELNLGALDTSLEDKTVTINNMWSNNASASMTLNGLEGVDDVIQLNNSIANVAKNDLIVNNLDLKVDSSSGGSLSLAGLELNNSDLIVGEGAQLSISNLNADADSTIMGDFTLSAGESDLDASFAGATTIRLTNKAIAVIDIDKDSSSATNLTLAGTSGTFYLEHVVGATLGAINTTGANVNLGNLDSDGKGLTLGSISSMEGGTLSFKLSKADVEEAINSGKGIVITSGASINLDSTTISIGQSDLTMGGLDLSTEQMTGITLVELGAGTVEGCDIIFSSPVYDKYFTNASYDANTGTIIADRNDAAYNNMGSTANGSAGLEMVSKSLLWDNPEEQAGMSHLADVIASMDSYKLMGSYGAADKLGAAVAGATTTSLGSAAQSDMDRQLRSVRNRTKMMGVDPSVVNEDMPYFNGWIAAEGASSTLDADGTYAGHKLNSMGGSIGVDVDLSDMLSVGASFSALYGDLSSDGADTAEGDFDTMYGSLFARVNSKRWTHSFVATFGTIDATLDRSVSTTAGSYKTKGETDGSSYGLMYEVGYTYALAEDASTCIQPIFNMSLVNSSISGYTETGSDAALTVGDQDNNYVSFGLGGLLETVVGENMYNRASVLSARAMMKFDAGDRQSEADVTLAHSVSGVTETVKGAEVGAVGIELGLGITIPVTEEVGAIFADVSCEFRSGMTKVNGSVGYRFSF